MLSACLVGETSQSERQSQQKNKDKYYNVQLTGLESLWATDIGLSSELQWWKTAVLNNNIFKRIALGWYHGLYTHLQIQSGI